MDRKWSKSADLQLLLLLYICIPVCMTKAATDYFDRFHSTHFNNNNKNIDDAIILSLSLYSSNQSPSISVPTLIVHLQGDSQTPIIVSTDQSVATNLAREVT